MRFLILELNNTSKKYEVYISCGDGSSRCIALIKKKREKKLNKKHSHGGGVSFITLL